MDFSGILDVTHGISNLVLSIVAVLILQILSKCVAFYLDGRRRREDKRLLDIKRAFRAIRIIAGDRWPAIREEIMKEEKFN